MSAERMDPEKRGRLAGRVVRAAEVALAARNYVGPLDMLMRIGWLDPGTVRRWQQGQLDDIEGAIQTKRSSIAEAMKLLRSWALAKDLLPQEASYLARTPQRQTLRFSRSGRPTARTDRARGKRLCKCAAGTDYGVSA